MRVHRAAVTSNGTYTCTVPPGTYSSGYSFTAPTSGGQALPMVGTAQGTLNVSTALGNLALRFVDSGQSGSGSGGGGSDGASLTVTNTGSLLLYSASAVTLGSAFGLYSALNGGNGAANTGTHGDDNAGSGADSVHLRPSAVPYQSRHRQRQCVAGHSAERRCRTVCNCARRPGRHRQWWDRRHRRAI